MPLVVCSVCVMRVKLVGLGNVSNVELNLLANALGDIQQTSDLEIFLENLRDIQRIYTEVLNDPIAFSVLNANTDEEFIGT